MDPLYDMIYIPMKYKNGTKKISYIDRNQGKKSKQKKQKKVRQKGREKRKRLRASET